MKSVISFDNVFKRFVLQKRSGQSFQELFVNSFNAFRRRRTADEFWAIQGVSFDIEPGDSVGIIGENGSGKSTTLKLMTRIIKPTSGGIQVTGRISALLELGSGFHPDLTGRENVYLNGSMLGFSRRRIDDSFKSIVEFAELQRFIDMPIKHYSSGMQMRLGFAIAISADPDILITDEVLAVGDESFQQKCLDRIWQLKRQGRTIVFVSHALSTVVDLCNRAIWLQEGRLVQDGSARKVVDEYHRHAYDKYQHQLESQSAEGSGIIYDGNRWGSGEAIIEEVTFLDATGRERHIYDTGETMVVRMRYRAYQPIEKPVFGVAIYRSDGTHINGPNTRLSNFPIDLIDGVGEVDYIIENLPLLPGTYEFTAAIYDYDSIHPYDHQHRLHTFKVRPGGSNEREGTVSIPCRWSLRSTHQTSAHRDANRLLQPA